MFNRYWREYPWMFQLMQFILLLLIIASFFMLAVIPVLVKLTGIPAAASLTVNEASSPNIIQASLLYQIMGTLGIFLVPALLFGYFTHPRPLQYLGLKQPGKPIQWLLTIIVVLSAIPIFLGIQQLVSHIELSETYRLVQEKRENQIKGMLSLPGLAGFLLSFFTLALLPALSEELFFRGVMFRLAAKGTKKTIFSIILTGLVFALFHSDFYGFLSIFLAGTLLGFIYYLTGSLWLSILAHMIHNGLQIVLLYVFRNNETVKMMDENAMPWSVPLIALLFFGISIYLLWKNRTVLPTNWYEDYDGEEKQESMTDEKIPE